MSKIESNLHPAQSSILYSLRHKINARYTELQGPTNLSSDTFKFHIRKLVSMGYILKVDTGEYTLTNIGKEFANRLDEKTGYEYPNPKSSVLMLVWAQTDDGIFVLAHQRSRRPYYGFWGIASAPLHRGVAAVQSAEQEFLKQTGIKVNFHPYGCRRIIDKNTQGDVLEDKLFVIMKAQCDEMLKPHDWTGGKSEWMSSEELLSKDIVFSTTAYALKTLNAPAEFSEETCIYTDYEY